MSAAAGVQDQELDEEGLANLRSFASALMGRGKAGMVDPWTLRGCRHYLHP